MSNKKGVIANIASLGIVQIANYVFPLVTIPIISRSLGPELFGVVNYGIAFIAYFILIINYGFDITATRKSIGADKGILDEIFSTVLCTKILLFCVTTLLFVFSIFLVPILRENTLISAFLYLTCISAVLTNNWIFQAKQQLSLVALLNFLGKLVSTIAIFILIKTKDDASKYALILSFSQIFTSILSFLISKYKYNLHFAIVSLRKIISVIKDERVFFVSLIVVSLYTTTNMVILGVMKPTTEVGFYSAADKIFAVVNTVLNVSMAQALFPFIGEKLSKDLKDGELAIQKIFPFVSLFVVFSSIFAFFLAPIIIKILFGGLFTPSVKILRVLMMLPPVVLLSNICGVQILLNLKKDKIFFNISLLGAAVSIILNIGLIYCFGAIGCAINALVIEILVTYLFYIKAKDAGVNVFNANFFKFRYLKNTIIETSNHLLKK